MKHTLTHPRSARRFGRIIPMLAPGAAALGVALPLALPAPAGAASGNQVSFTVEPIRNANPLPGDQVWFQDTSTGTLGASGATLTTLLDGLVPGPIGEYAWNFGDGSPNTVGPAAAAWHVYAKPGRYTVTEVVTYVLGILGGGTVSHVVTVENPPTAQFTVPSVSRAGVARLDASGSHPAGRGGIASYAWSFSDHPGVAPVTTHGPLASHRFAAPGRYTIHLTVTDSAGDTTSTARSVRIPASGTGSGE